MHLKKLSLVGFKSFLEPTEIEFGMGMTGVVGPNGCGKTNILDALRWVLGEQRSSAMRSLKMEEVIFNGSRDAKPLGMSEVSLTIANSKGVLPTEYTDLTITRRLYRSGESEYSLNKQPCRLRDILDLFADTGMGAHSYSVIQQDMIEAVLSENPEERRFLFDEAAGITKYKHRKRAALRKLDATEADLLRLQDIASEVRTRVNSLKRQSNKARRYSDLREEWQGLHLRVAFNDYQSLQDRVRTQSTRADNLGQDLDAAKAKVAASEAQRDALRTQSDHAEQTVESARQAVSDCDLKLSALKAEREKASAEGTAYSKRQGELNHELDGMALKRRDRDTRISELNSEIEVATIESEEARDLALAQNAIRSEADSAWQTAKDEQSEAQQTLDQAVGRCRQIETELVHEETSLVSLCEQLAEAEAACRSAETEASSASEQKSGSESREETARKSLAESERALSESRQEREDHTEACQRADDVVTSTQAEMAEFESQLNVLQSWVETYRGYQGAVPDLLTKNRASGIHDTVAEIIRPERGFEVPVAAALGERAEFLVCRDRSTASKVLTRLEKGDIGRATLVIMDALKNVKVETIPIADARPLTEVVTARDGFETLQQFLLSGYYLWEGKGEPDTRKVPNHAALVTRSGRLYRGEALAAAGAPAATSLLARKDELEVLRRKLEKQTEVVSAAERVASRSKELLEEICANVAAFEDVLYEDQNAYRACSLEAERARSRMESAARETDRDRKMQESLTVRVEESRQRIVTLKTDIKSAHKILNTQKTLAQETSGALDSSEQVRTGAILKSGETQVHEVSARGKLDALINDRERTREMLWDLQSRVCDLAMQMLDSGIRCREAKATLERIASERTDLEQQRGELESVYVGHRTLNRDLLTNVHALEKDLKEVRLSAEEISTKHHDAELASSEARLEVTALCDRIRETMNIELSEQAHIEDVEPGQRALLQAQAREMKEHLDRMGTVNLLALEEYDEQKERLDFLDQQLDDMHAAKKILIETIDKINAVAKTKFVETFTQVEKNFNELFSTLFEGGDAQVKLVDPDDPLESAISIMARPRGKRPVTILQLSGGERALTSIALLFSLYMVKPSPFCILDEIDAPLDDANIGRFLALLSRFSKQTQFIVITHNKMTMQATDMLYGVTMERPGISKLVSVKLHEAVEVAGQK